MTITIPAVVFVAICALLFAAVTTSVIYRFDRWLNRRTCYRKNHKRKCKK